MQRPSSDEHGPYDNPLLLEVAAKMGYVRVVQLVRGAIPFEAKDNFFAPNDRSPAFKALMAAPTNGHEDAALALIRCWAAKPAFLCTIHGPSQCNPSMVAKERGMVQAVADLANWGGGAGQEAGGTTALAVARAAGRRRRPVSPSLLFRINHCPGLWTV